jgi:hypothetical protein
MDDNAQATHVIPNRGKDNPATGSFTKDQQYNARTTKHLTVATQNLEKHTQGLDLDGSQNSA